VGENSPITAGVKNTVGIRSKCRRRKMSKFTLPPSTRRQKERMGTRSGQCFPLTDRKKRREIGEVKPKGPSKPGKVSRYQIARRTRKWGNQKKKRPEDCLHVFGHRTRRQVSTQEKKAHSRGQHHAKKSLNATKLLLPEGTECPEMGGEGKKEVITPSPACWRIGNCEARKGWHF